MGLLELKQPKSEETDQLNATRMSEIQSSIAVHQFALLTRTCCRTLPITEKQPPHNSVASFRSDVARYKGNERRHWPWVVSVQLFHLVSFRRTDQLTYGAQGLCVGRGEWVEPLPERHIAAWSSSRRTTTDARHEQVQRHGILNAHIRSRERIL
jgi:hypothetical protein